MGALFINHLEEGSKNNPRKKQNKTKQNLHYNLYYNKRNGLAAQEGDLWHLRTFPVRLGPARHAALSHRETRHPLIMLPCTNQMQKRTWKDVEGKTRCSVRAFRSHCEDRNSSADRAGGMNRNPHFREGWAIWPTGQRCTARGLLSGFPKTELHRMCKPQEEKGAERALATRRQRRQADCGNRGRLKSAFGLKSRWGRLHSTLSPF